MYENEVNKIKSDLPVIEGESVMSSGLGYLVVLLAVTDGDSECAAGVIVCESVDVCMSLYGCVDVVMLSLGSVCGI